MADVRNGERENPPEPLLMIERDAMRANPEQLERVRDRIATGEYRIDALEVAQAMLDRIGAREFGRMALSEGEGDRGPTRGRTGLRAI